MNPSYIEGYISRLKPADPAQVWATGPSRRPIPASRGTTAASFRFWLTSVVLFSWGLLGWPPIFTFAPGIQKAEAAYSVAVSNVNPGWSDSTKRVVFYNGSLIFLLYSKGDGNVYYKSSADNISWSAESTLIGSANSSFDMYLVNDTKLDLVYLGSPNTTYVRTCTISGATITCGNASAVEAIAHSALAVARSGAGDRIYVVGQFNNDFLRIYSANQTGDAQNVTSWTREVEDSSANPTAVAIVPYQGADKALVVYTRDGGGSNGDGIFSRVITHPTAGSEVEAGNFNSLPNFSSPIRISDTDFRIVIKNPTAFLEEWTWNGTSWSQLVIFNSDETDQDRPSLFYDRISGDMHLFSVDTGTDDVERHYQPSGGSWQTEVVADGGEATAHSFPITQMHEPPYGSSRTAPRVLVWAYRVANGSNFDLKVGTLSVAGCGVVSDPAYVAATAQNGQAIIYWSSANPALILRKSGSAITDAPTNGTTYTAGNTIGASTVVYSGSAVETSFTEARTNGTTYYYKVFAKNGTCYSSLGVEVNARPEAGPTPAWSYMMANGSTMRAGIAGEGSVNTAGNFQRIISLNTNNGTQAWTPAATTGAVQSWLSWLPVGSWSYRKKLTIDATKVGAGGVTDFPVLVSITDADLRDKAQTDGDDIIFTASDGSTRLSHEIERYTSSTGELIAWVKVPSLSSAANTDIYMYYGNPGVGSQQDTAGVWSNGYVGVWHLKETTGGAGAIKDSTSNANHGTDTNGPALGSAGKVGNAISFDGVDDLVDLGNNSSLNVSYLTIDFWVKVNGWVDNGGILAKGDDTYRQYWIWTYGGAVSFEVDEGVLQNTAWTPALGAWTHLALTYDGANVITRRNGVVENTYPQATGPINAQTPSLKFGNIPGYAYANVALDEVRISTVSRSAAWITTEYNNQDSPSMFYSVGGEEPSTGGTLIAGDQSGRVYAVYTTTGATNWSVLLSGADAVQAPVAAQLRQWSDASFQAAYTDDVLFVATRNASATNNKVFALRASNGQVLWTFNGTGTYNVDYIVGMPWVDYARNRVYAVSRSNGNTQASLWAIDTLNGSLVASRNLNDIEASPTMSYDGNTLYIGNLAGTLYAIDLTSPTLANKWSYPLGASYPLKGFVWQDWNNPQYLYFSTGGDIVWSLQDNGGSASFRWAAPVTNPSTPLPTADRLYVGSSDGKVHQLRLTDGCESPNPPCPGYTAYLVGSGAYQVGDVSTETLSELFVPTTEGKLYKLPLPLP